MHRITQEDFIAMLMQGVFYQGYIEGVGIACTNTFMVESSSPPPYAGLIAQQRDTTWYHSVSKLAIKPLKVIVPKREIELSQDLRELYQRIPGSNFSRELNGWVDRLREEAQSEIDSIDRKIRELRQEITELNASTDEREIRRRDDKIRRKTNDIEDLERKKAEYTQVLSEINTLALSDQRYDIRIDDSYSTSTTKQGMLTVDVDTGTIIVSLPPGANIGFFAHELKHAYQFEIGRVSLRKSSIGIVGGGNLYDKHDEMEAFNRGALFREGYSISNINRLPEAYKDLPGMDFNMNTYNWHDGGIGPMTAERLQRIATRSNNIIRYNGETYFPQSRR